MTSGRFIMMQPFKTLLFCVVVIVISTCTVLCLDSNKSFHEVDEVENAQMIRDYLMKISKHARKTMSPHGDTIDCVLFHKQPAFQHPLLKGKLPTELPKRSNQLNSTNTFQLWNANGEKCPEGTIPIRRMKAENILKARSLKRFPTKHLPVIEEVHIGPKAEWVQFAGAAIGPGAYFGATASLNIWAPHVDEKLKYSLTRISLTSNDLLVEDPDAIDAIEAGWMVYPDLYNNSDPRLFIYWTAYEFEDTGCFDLLCSSFVHTNPRFVIGGSLNPASDYDSIQEQFTVSIEKAKNSGDWLLLVGRPEKQEVGYWPEQVLPQFKPAASYVSFGGEVLNTQSDELHTTSQMGSGHFPKEGYQRAAFVSNIEVIDPGYRNVPLSSFTRQVFNPLCYDASIGTPELTPDMGVHIFYGGPGGGIYCR